MGHWYGRDGSPQYTIKGANGVERDTTLRDARKLGLVPSVTTILGVQDKPALLTWKQNQILHAAMEHPFKDGFDPKVWAKQIVDKSNKIGREAAERGSIIHDALEQYYLTGDTKDDAFIEPVVNFMHEHFPGVPWVPEASFTSLEYGYGGKVDMHSPQGIVLDFKTKDTADVKKMVAYDGHHMQTAAYAVGLAESLRFDNSMSTHKVRRYNLFISTHTPGLITLTESANFDKDWGMYYNLLMFWQLSNNIEVNHDN